MKKLTVNQFSKQTGIARSKIYYQIKINKIKINKGKINYEDALQLFNSKELEKHNTINNIDIRHILNTLNMQNLNLQRQLDLAYEREKFYLAELAHYRQLLLSKTILNTPTNKIDIQAKLENNLTDRNEDSQKLMRSESENQVHIESFQNINKETSSVNEVESQTKEMVEQNPDALIGTRLPNQDEREHLLNLKRQIKSTAQVVKVTAKKVSIPLTARNPNRTPINETIADQDGLNKKNHRN
ncbi:hypothetical protein [Acinetobacter bereziniae]|uniref:hypothetical protein n=1 Tax=Acinetobacter bereziniae TaxID=106648 RepID=UPI00148F3ABE|nr:hypothetical protein [Acinetobacter bereziniae]